MKSRLFSIFLSLLLGTMLYLALTLPAFHISAAQVSGNQRIGADEINSVLNTAGQSIFMLRSADLETRLRLNYPELASAHVSISLPNTVVITIQEREPVLLWQQAGGYTWIDADGVAFRPRGDMSSLPATIVPVKALAAPPASVVTAADPLSPSPFISPELVKAIQSMAPTVPAGVPLEYDPKYGLGWSDSRGWKAFFGITAKDMPLKLQVYQSLVDSLAQKGIQPAFISVQYANAPYYRISQ
jgi:cell division protein FtsQ